MKAKKLISLLLSFLMVLGIVPTFAVAASTEGETVYTDYYYEDFEDISIDATTEEICEALGWDYEKVSAVVELEIVETVYLREFTAKLANTHNTLWEAMDAYTGEGGLGWVDGEDEYENINHRTARVDQLNVYNLGVDCTTLPSYTKRLLIKPIAANADLSINLVSGITTNSNGLYVDFELTPNEDTAYNNNSMEAVAADKTYKIPYASDSYVGIGMTLGDTKYTQAWTVNGSIVHTDAANTETKAFSGWYTGNAQKYGSGVNLKTTNEYNFTYSDGVETDFFLYEPATNAANGLTFGFRTRVSASTFYSRARATNYNKSGTAAKNPWSNELFSTISDGSAGAVTSKMKQAFASSTSAGASLEINNSGVSYYIDNIIVSDNNGNNTATTTTVTVDNVSHSVRLGATVGMSYFAPSNKQLVYAVVNDEVKLADSTMTFAASNPAVTTRCVAINTRYGASMRLSDPTGLRWTTDISLADLEALAADTSISDIKVGTLITKTESLTDANGVWSALATDKFIDVEAKLDALKEANADNNGNVTFAGSIVNIKSENLDKAFSGIGYISMKVSDKTVVIYGNYSAEAHSRVVSDLAQAALADVQTTNAGEYTEALAVGDKYVVVDGETVTTETVAEGQTLYSRYDKDERKVLWGFFVQ